MKSDRFKIISSIIFFISLSTLISNSIIIEHAPQDSKSNYILPFDNFYITYTLKAKKDNLPVFNIDLTVKYTKINVSSNSSPKFDYIQNMTFKSFLLVLTGETQENATFLENSSTRLISLNATEGNYVSWLIYYVTSYNTSENAQNWEPFWIFSNDVNLTYPIYSFNLNLTKKTELYPSDSSLFNYNRPVLIFNGEQNVSSEYENISNSFGLIYDNYTGILLKGVLGSWIVGTNATNHYYANFEMIETNGFDQFPPFPIKSSVYVNISDYYQFLELITNKYNKPNYLILGTIILLPLFITGFKLAKIREISGGTE
jgi:hypothetical protein